jgi:hypothetical protein
VSKLSANFCAKPRRIRCYADPSKVQTIGIPAGADRQIFVILFMRVPIDSGDQQIKFVVVKFDQVLAYGSGKQLCALPVPVITPVTKPTDVMEKRKVFDDALVRTVRCSYC